MEERKHIDRLYQEKFKDFEATPREMVWKNISSKLQEKERKRNVLPIWYRIAGVAALLALFFNFASGLFKSSPSTGALITKTQQNTTFGEFDLVSDSYNQDMFKSSIILQALILETKKSQLREYFKPQSKKENTRPIASARFLNNPGIFQVDNIENNPFNISSGSLNLENYVARDGEIPTFELKEIPAPLENLIAFSEDTNLKNIPKKRLRITTTAAPVFFNNFGNGNAIDERFANNEGGGEISMAYGVNVAYQLSNRIKIRSGVNKVDLSYNTRDIAFTAAVNPTVLSGVDYQAGIPNYRIENKSTRPFSNISASTEFSRSSFASPANGYLNQRIGFIEVPVEIEYVIIDKKIGLNLIGGGSTLFLDENMISLNSADFSTNIGEANNINSLSFSTNIGVGLDYKISPQFQVNVEPILKYQINTFNETQDLNSYYFGIYSGFSFKF